MLGYAEGNFILERYGLGLYLSREIIKSCGGDVSYKSAQDGSNFILTFPGG
jgi:signal transduction histidine kinase